MKLFSALMFSLLFVSTAHAAGYPVCDESESAKAVYPCAAGEKDTAGAFVDMMLNNKSGYELVKNKRHLTNGFIRSVFSEPNIRVLILSEKSDKNSHNTSTTMRYDMLLTDCLGTDDCKDSFVWTVIETTTGDGYVSESKYKNYLVPGKAIPVSASR